MATVLRNLPGTGGTRSYCNDREQRRLAEWNRRRLAPGLPAADWELQLARDHAMMRLEGNFLETLRDEVRAAAEAVPTDPDGFLAWFEALKETEMVSAETELASEFFFSASRVPALKVPSFNFSGRSDH